DVDALDDFVVMQQIDQATGAADSPIHGREASDIMAALAPRVGPDRLLDLMLRTGPYGDGFGDQVEGLSLTTLEANPHGIDLGPLMPRIPEVLRTASGKIELTPEPLVRDVERVRDALERVDDDMVLIGRREMRSNNSWMHNLEVLVKGKKRCTLQIHPQDAARIGVVDGGLAQVSSRVNTITIPAEVTDAIMPGVVSIPHGWGHQAPDMRTQIATEHAGVNGNLLTD